MVKTCKTLKLLPESKSFFFFFHFAVKREEADCLSHKLIQIHISALYLLPLLRPSILPFFVTVELGFTVYGHEAFVLYILGIIKTFWFNSIL